MKYIIQLIRLFVGVVFIVSGFVKLIDPMGFSFKLGEYFAPDVLNLPFLLPFAYYIGVCVVVVELVLGIMLLVGYRTKLTLQALLAITIFFGFLTFYSAYFNKVTDCGCFGDAIKFTPWQSFIKDMILLVLVLILITGQKYIKPIFKGNIPFVISGLSVLGCLIFVWYTHTHLPIIDFRPYKIGNNIQDGMTIPEGAPKPVFDYHWKFNIDGKEQVIITQGAFPDIDGDLVSVETKKVSDGYKPPIHDFTIEKNEEDYTSEFLQEEKLMLIISYDLENADLEGFKPIKVLTDKALKNGYKVIGMTASIAYAPKVVKDYQLNFDFYFTDQTTLKTIIRSNPAIMVLKKGTITQKANWRGADKIQL